MELYKFMLLAGVLICITTLYLRGTFLKDNIKNC